GHDAGDGHHDEQFDESETALAARPSLAPLHIVHRETSFRVHGKIQEKWRAPRRKLSAGARTVPTPRGHRPSVPLRRRASLTVPRGLKISAERSLPAMTVGIVVCGWCPPGIEVTWTCQPIDSRSPADEHSRETFLTLPPVADVGTSDDSASELVGTHALRRALRCCLSLWRTPPGALGFRRGERHESSPGGHRRRLRVRERLRTKGLDRPHAGDGGCDRELAWAIWREGGSRDVSRVETTGINRHGVSPTNDTAIVWRPIGTN